MIMEHGRHGFFFHSPVSVRQFRNLLLFHSHFKLTKKDISMNKSNHESKKITWTQILRAVIQAAIAALTALGITSCASLI